MKALYTNYFRKNQNEDPVIKVLENIPIFENLSERELEKIARLTHERNYKKDEQIFKKLAPAEGMYVIINGTVEIYDPETKNTYADLLSGDFFGELALLDDEPRSASALAKQESRLIGFFRTDLLTLIERSPELGNRVLLNLSRVLGERLRKTNQEMANSSE